MVDRDLGRFLLRPARKPDLDSYLALAQATGGGFTTLPADEEILGPRLGRNEASFASTVQRPGGEDYVFVLEDRNSERGQQIVGTSAIYSKLGASWPFYSFRVSELNRHSPSLAKVVRNKIMVLTSDFDDCTEVGGLFLLGQYRGSMAGRLLSLGRFIFMADHRARVSERIVAELRGVVDDDNQSPFWSAVGQHFFDLPFQEADRFGAVNGNQFIADLMPSYPIYINMLPLAAQKVIGLAHKEGGGALQLLMQEGFINEGYVDIFDAGPTVHCQTGNIRSIRESRTATFETILSPHMQSEAAPAILSTGDSHEFRCTVGAVQTSDGGGIGIDHASADTLSLHRGAVLRYLLI